MRTATRISPQSLTHLPRPGRNPAYLRFMRRQACCVTGQNWGVEACHTGPRGLSQKADDLETIPLIRKLHRGGEKSYHVLGRVEFEFVHGIWIAKTILYYQALAISQGVDLTPVPLKSKYRKGLGRAGAGKRDTTEGAA